MPARRNPPPAPQQPPRLVVPRAEAADKIQAHLDEGRELRRQVGNQSIRTQAELEEAERQMWRWSDYTYLLLELLFDNPSVANSTRSITVVGVTDEISLPTALSLLDLDWGGRLSTLQSVLERIDLYQAPPPPEPRQIETPLRGVVQAMENSTQLSTDQKKFVQTVFDYFHEHGEWPTYRQVDHTLHRLGLDAEAIFESLRSQLTDGAYGPSWDITAPSILRVPMVARCTGSEEELDAFIRVLRLCVGRELNGDEPKVSSAELLADGIFSKLLVQKVSKLFQVEPYMFASGGDQGWDLGIIMAGARKFRGVKTLEEYLATRTQLLANARPVTSSTYDSAGDARPVVSMGGSAIPVEIRDSLDRFRKDHPDIGNTAFIMMRFSASKAHQEIAAAIRDTLKPLGISAVRADDKQYHSDLFPNIRTYMHGCGLGIAVFERIEVEAFNPNVALEVGYMMALGKPVCLLKDKTLVALQADLVGKLYQPFDPQDIGESVQKELSKWIKDNDLTGQVE